MSIVYPDKYYDRTDASKLFDRHLFLHDSILQSAELNEIQSDAQSRLKSLSDVLFRNGAVINAAQVSVNSATGAVLADQGIIYAEGKMYAPQSSTFTISTSGSVAIGVYLQKSIVTEDEDSSLRDPAIQAISYQEPGASRLKTTPIWGWVGDGNSGDFYRIYSVEDGQLKPYAAPPDVNPINQAIARYDRQSTGGRYIASGMEITLMDNSGASQQIVISEGEARLNGREIIYRTSKRFLFEEVPDIDTVTAETRSPVTSDNPFSVTVNRPPMTSVTFISGQRSIGVDPGETLTKSGTDFDSLEKGASLVSVTSVWQGATSYEPGTHWSVTGEANPPTNRIHWTTGTRPAEASSFKCAYAYTVQYPATADLLANSSSSHIGILNVDEGSQVTVNYQYKLPRYDRIALNEDGVAVLVKGLPSFTAPKIPHTPNRLLPMAVIYQTWDSTTRTIQQTNVRMVPMQELMHVARRVDDLTDMMAECRNAIYGSLQDQGRKRGIFTDSLSSEKHRDLGLDNTALIDLRRKTLAIGVQWNQQYITHEITTNTQVADSLFLEQARRSGTSLINPYFAFTGFVRIPGIVELTPSFILETTVDPAWYRGFGLGWDYYIAPQEFAPGSIEAYALDQWNEGREGRQQRWHDAETNEWVIAEIVYHKEWWAEMNQPYTYLGGTIITPRNIHFSIEGFLPDEPLGVVLFDGVAVSFSASPLSLPSR